MKKTLHILTTSTALAVAALLITPTAQAKPTLSGDEIAIIAVLGGASFNFSNDATTYQQIAAAAVASHLPVNRAVIAAFSLADHYGLTARDADPFIVRAVVTANAAKSSNVTKAVQAAFTSIKNATASSTLSLNSNVVGTTLTAGTTDDAAVAAALVASAVDPIVRSSTLSTKQKTSTLKSIVTNSVKSSLAASNKKHTMAIAGGAAGVATGAVALTQLNSSTANDSLVSAIISAVVKASKADIVAIVQSATEAAAYVYGNTSPTPFATTFIYNAAVQGYKPKKVNSTLSGQINGAITAGVQAATDLLNNSGSTYGVGAKGILNYAFNSSTSAVSTPITDITGL